MIPIAAPLLLKWFVENWKSVLAGLILLVFLGSMGECQRRGSRVEQLKVEKATLSVSLKAAKADHKEKLEACGEKINEINEAHEEAIGEANARASRIDADLVAVTEEADRARRASLQTRAEVAASIRRAETAEEKIDVFLEAIQERIEG